MNLIKKIKILVIGKDAYLKSLEKKYKEDIRKFEQLQTKLYNENMKNYVEFIKKKCLDKNITDAEKERLENIIKEIRQSVRKINEYNNFVKYLTIFSKIQFEKENSGTKLNLFRIFYKSYKDKEISNLIYKDSVLYDQIDEMDIEDAYDNIKYEIDDFKKEIPTDFYDNNEIEEMIYNFLFEKNIDYKFEDKDKIISILIKHYSNPLIFFDADFIERAVLLNYYYLVYKITISSKYKIDKSNVIIDFEDEEENEDSEDEEKEGGKTKYNIRKAIYIILFLLFLLLFGKYGQDFAFLILIYYAIKGMIK